MFGRIKTPTPMMSAMADLERAKHDLLTNTSLREYHGAMETMLQARIVRLKQDIVTLSPPKESE
jgi:hypothetical protein